MRRIVIMGVLLVAALACGSIHLRARSHPTLDVDFRALPLAARDAIRRGDVLVSIDGREVTSRADVAGLMERLDQDGTVEIVVDRSGERIGLTVFADERQPMPRRTRQRGR